MIAVAIMLCAPVEALAQSSEVHTKTLEYGTRVALVVDETFSAGSSIESGLIHATVLNDIYSDDGENILIKSGTPALINYTLEQNEHGGKPGKLTLSGATTKTVDNQRITLQLGYVKKGGSKVLGVVAISTFFFPLGLLSCIIKGGMPKLKQGSVINSTITEDISVNVK